MPRQARLDTPGTLHHVILRRIERSAIVKEFIGSLKVIFALVLATTIGLFSWLVQNYQSAGKLLLYADVLLVVVLVITLILIKRKILSDIKRLKEL
jgi:Zn-dependent protease